MSVGVQNFRGRRLSEARLARGLYKNALGDMIGVTGTQITRYEEGIDCPQWDKLAAISDKLNFPIAFFMQPEWQEPVETVFWRSRAAETKSARLMTEQRMIWVCEIFSFLEREVDFPAVDLPNLAIPDDFRLITPEIIERAAENLRNYWRLMDQPIPDVILSLENAGIPVVTLDIASDKQDGFCFRSETLGRPFVGINRYNVSASRARYDAAHELGHVLLHRKVKATHIRDAKCLKIIEDQAHLFAGAFLFPRASFLREVGIVSLDYLANIKKKWGMSIAAMIFRAFNLGLIDGDERVDLYKKMTRRRWRGALQEPFDDRISMPVESPRMMRRAIQAVLDAGIFGVQQLTTAIPIPIQETEVIAGLAPGSLDLSRSTLLAKIKNPDALRAIELESGNVISFAQRQKR